MMRITTTTANMKSIETTLSIKGLAGINVDSTKANNNESAKAFVRVIRNGKLCATSSLSQSLKASPTEKANAKVKRHVALWNDTEQSLVFQTARGNVMELQICLRLQNGKEVQIGTGSLKMPVKGATDVKIREGRRNYSSPYRIDSSGDARLRMHVTWEEKEAGKEPKAVVELSPSRVALDHSGFEVSAKSANRELQMEAVHEQQSLVTPSDPENREEDSFEPSVEQVFVPKRHDNEATNDASGNKSKNMKKKSPLAKWMGWGRSKKSQDETPTKHVVTTVKASPKQVVATAPVQKGKETPTKKTASVAQVQQRKDTTPKKTSSVAQVPNEPFTTPKKNAPLQSEPLTTPKKTASQPEPVMTPKKVVSAPPTQNEQLATPKKTVSDAPAQKESLTTPRKTASPLAQVQKEQFTSLKKTLSIAQAEKEEEATPKRTGAAAPLQKESETTPNKMESIAQTKKEGIQQTNSVPPEEARKNAPHMDTSDSASAWKAPVFIPLHKEETVVSPERSNSSVTTKTANSTPSSAVRQDDTSPHEPFMFSTPRSDFRLRSKPGNNDGFEELDFSFPTPDFQRHTTPRMGSKRPSSQPTESQRNDAAKGDASFQQDETPVFVSPEPDIVTELKKNQERHARNQPSPASITRTQTRDMDDYSMYSEDDSTFMAKPKQIFGLIKCCIMGDEDSIYGFDETLTFDETLGEDTTVHSYDDTFESDLPLNDWWCGRPQAPAVLRRRQIWKERMQQLAEKNSNVKELFESESEAGSTCAGDDDEATAKDEETLEQGQIPTTAHAKPVDSSNSETLGLVPPPAMRAKISP